MINIETALNTWTNTEDIRLRAGEIDQATMSTILTMNQTLARWVRGFDKLDEYSSVTELLIKWLAHVAHEANGIENEDARLTVLSVTDATYRAVRDAALEDDNAREDAAIAELGDALWDSPTGSPEITTE